ncbi:MAG TPA: P-II family nitrogen regulator [Bryobacteraceae bacterium]|nr:P-II family nitrogen regulator [Bryobacteraceae bacterium]
MQKIEAYIQPFKLDPVKGALIAIGINGISISEIRGHGRQKGHTAVYRGAEYEVDLVPKIKIEVFAADAAVESIIEAITQTAATGKIGDGKIFVSPVNQAIRIRNGDRGESAL